MSVEQRIIIQTENGSYCLGPDAEAYIRSYADEHNWPVEKAVDAMILAGIDVHKLLSGKKNGNNHTDDRVVFKSE